MTRSEEQIRAAVATAAGLADFAPGTTWAQALFAGADFSRPADPDRRLLAALIAEYPELERHAELLPGRLHVEWLERILDIDRLPVVPDSVVAHATVDPKRAPVVVPAGTLLRGGKDAEGRERRYATDDALTAHGAALVGVRSYSRGTGRGTVASAEPWPLSPTTGDPSAHLMRVSSALLAFAGGTMTVRLTFVGGSAAHLQHAVWTYPLPDGTLGTAVASGFSGSSLQLLLQVGCAADDGPAWVEAQIPPDRAVPTQMSFTRVDVAVIARTGVVPDAAAYNDGLLDVSKEFRPFGEVARRGDAFYVRSDEAFGKPLASLTVTLQLMSADTGTMSPVAWGYGMSYEARATMMYQVSAIYEDSAEMSPATQSALDVLASLIGDTGEPRVEWQRRVDGQWQQFGNARSDLGGVSATMVTDGDYSEPTLVAGGLGHHVRAFLAEGDFGWQRYQEELAQFATDAVAQPATSPTMPTPPPPAVVSRVVLSYTTVAKAATVTVLNGWSRRTRAATATGAFAPFTAVVSPAGDSGMIAIGIDLPEQSIGSSVSLYLEVDSASPCGTSADPAAHWEYWTGSIWQPLTAADGTRLLRESGILRIVAPTDWTVGCTDVDQPAGRWLRIVTTEPERLGTIRTLTPDAVLASYRSAATDPQSDPTPGTPLPPGAIKGPVTAISGIKKIGNLAGVRGRGPESDVDYRARASALTRHRGRAVTAWDFEHLVAQEFPEVAAVRCLPHTDADGSRRVGRVGLVIVPDRPDAPSPRPSVSLAGRISDALAPMLPMHATAVVLCPLYVEVTIEADVVLRRGTAALTGRDAVRSALETWLHPTGVTPTRFGRSLYLSSLQAFLEHLSIVDSVRSVLMHTSSAEPVERIDVDVCRGLYCSSGRHRIAVQEQL